MIYDIQYGNDIEIVTGTHPQKIDDHNEWVVNGGSDWLSLWMDYYK